MSSFNYLLSRTYLLSEAKGEKGEKNIMRNLPPVIGGVFKKASQEAKIKGGIPTREGKKAAIIYIKDYVEMKLGESLNLSDEKSLLKFTNISAQGPLIDFLEATAPTGSDLTYAEILRNITDADIEAINNLRNRDVEHAVAQSMAQRGEERQSKYEATAAALELKKQEREEFKKLAQTANAKGDTELAGAMNSIGTGLDRAIAEVKVGADREVVQLAVTKVLDELEDEIASAKAGEYSSDVYKAISNVRAVVEDKINNVDQLQALVNQLLKMNEYQEIAYSLSAAVKGIKSTYNNIKEEEAEDDFDLGQSEDFDPGYSELPDPALEMIANEYGFSSTTPGPDTYKSSMYEIEELYVSEDGKVYLGKFINQKAPYFVTFEQGRVSSRTPDDLREPIEQILAGRDPEPEDEEAASDNEEVVSVAGYPYQVQFNDSGEVSAVTPSDKDAKINISLVNKYIKSGFPLNRAIAAATSYEDNNLANRGGEDAMMMGESYTSMYLTEQKKTNRPSDATVTQSMSFKEKFKPKTSFQLEELRRYGL